MSTGALTTLVPLDEHIRNQSKIAKLIDFNEVFELVKSTLLKKFDLHRAGLSNLAHYAKYFGSISYIAIEHNSLK